MSKSNLARDLRVAIRDDDKSVYQISKITGVPHPGLYQFLAGQRGITLTSAEKLADYLGLELKPQKRQRKEMY